MPALAICIALLAAAPAEGPVAPSVQHAVEARLARLAVEMVPGSLERASGPDCSPYRLFSYRDASAAQVRGVAVSDTGEVAVAGDPEGLGRLFTSSRVLERHGPAAALAIWRVLAGAAPLLDAAAIQALPEDERKAVFAPRQEELAGGARVSGFLRQGEELFRVRLDVLAARAEVELKPLGELMGRDDLDEAARALRSADEILRAAAVFELAEKQSPRAFEVLVGALEDRSANVRATVANALVRQSRLNPARRAPADAALQKALAREEDSMAREALTKAVADLQPTEAEKKREKAAAAPAKPGTGPSNPKAKKGK